MGDTTDDLVTALDCAARGEDDGAARILRALARTDEQSIPCLYHHKIIDANRRDKLSWTRNKISAGVQCMALA